MNNDELKEKYKDLSDNALDSKLTEIGMEKERRGLTRFYRNRRLWMLIMFTTMEIMAVAKHGPTTLHDYVLSGILGLMGGYMIHEHTDKSLFIRK